MIVVMQPGKSVVARNTMKAWMNACGVSGTQGCVAYQRRLTAPRHFCRVEMALGSGQAVDANDARQTMRLLNEQGREVSVCADSGHQTM